MRLTTSVIQTERGSIRYVLRRSPKNDPEARLYKLLSTNDVSFGSRLSPVIFTDEVSDESRQWLNGFCDTPMKF